MYDRFKIKQTLIDLISPNVKSDKVRWVTSKNNTVTLGYEDDESNREVQFDLPISLFEIIYEDA